MNIKLRRTYIRYRTDTIVCELNETFCRASIPEMIDICYFQLANYFGRTKYVRCKTNWENKISLKFVFFFVSKITALLTLESYYAHIINIKEN